MKKHLLSICILAFSILLIVTGCQAEPIPVASITLDKTETSLLLGASEKLVYATAPSDAETGFPVTWSSDNPDIVSVDQQGNITAKKLGEATVTATTENGLAATCRITVKPVMETSIELDHETLTLLVGDTAKLKAALTPSNTTDKTITWSSENEAVATVEEGTVTAMAPGNAVIKAKSNSGLEAECKVTVNPIIAAGIGFEKTTLYLEKTAEPIKVDVVFTPTNTTDKTVTWSSSNVETATVDPEGIITPMNTGTTVIKAVHGELEAEFTLEIVDVISEKGKLSTMLTEKGLTDNASLRIAGSLDNDDFAAIKTLSSLKALDLKCTDITALPPYNALNTSMEKLILPPSLTSLSENQFYGTALTSIELSEGLKVIGNYAFWGTGISEITIPGTVETIGTYPFYSCPVLATVILSEGLTTIPDWFLAVNPAVNSIILPSTLKVIGIYAFQGTALTEITIPDSVTTIGTRAFSECNSLTSITLPESLTSIPDMMCLYSTSLESITFKGNKLNSIGKWAFDGTALAEVKIPSSVEIIDTGAFLACRKLSSVEFLDPQNSRLETIGENAFMYTAIEECMMPDSATTLGPAAFSECKNLKKVHISEKAKTVEDNCFLVCPKLTTINLPDSIVSIGRSAFSTNSIIDFPKSTLKMPANLETLGITAFSSRNYKKLILNDKLREIGEQAFDAMGIITEVTIPASVTKMTDYWPGKITRITFEGTVPPKLEPISSLNGDYRKWMTTAEVYVPEEAVQAYTDSEWFNGELPHFETENLNKPIE